MTQHIDAHEPLTHYEAPDLRRWQERLRPPPALRAALPYRDRFDATETEALSRHLLPQGREEKWVILHQDPHLDVYSSWTGVHVFRVRLESEGDGTRVTEAWVNRDPDEHRARDEAWEVALLRWLVRGLALGQPAEFPFDPARPLEEAFLEAWAIGGPAAFRAASGLWRAVPADDSRAVTG